MRCSCGSTDVDYDSNGVNVVCVNCGLVLSENSIVSEVNFTESSSGISSVVGQFVSSSSSRGLSSSAKKPNSAGYGRDSREQTLNAGRKACQQLSDLLRLKPHHVEAATRYFALAVQHNFIQGRRTSNVVAACLYIVCRREKTSHLLIDFADVLQTNLYVLGSTLLKFIRVLHISLPIIDPSLYIHRFAAQLELQPLPQSTSTSSGAASSSSVNPIIDSEASAVHIVAMTALRLVARMKRDWLQVGRRPSGICGACLLIACRMHGYRRTQREILDVVKICDATLRRRMLEFVNSSGSEMTFQEFEQKTEQQHQHGKDRQSSKKQKVEHDNGTVNTSMSSVEEEDADEDYEEDDDTTLPDAAMSAASPDSLGHDPPAFIRAQESDTATQRLQARASEVEAELRNRGLLPNDSALKVEWERELNELLQTEEFQQQRESVTLNQDVSLRKLIQEHFRAVSQGYSEHSINNNDVIQVKKQEPQDEEETKHFIEEKKMEPPTGSTREGGAGGTGADAYVGLTAAEAAALADGEYLLANLARTGTGQAEASSTGRDVVVKSDAPAAHVALDLSDVSDAEMSEYLLDENEIAFKTRMWDHIHSAYLQQQAEKKAVKAEAEAAAAQTQQTNTTPKKPIIRKKDRLTASEAFINATSITNNNSSNNTANNTTTGTSSAGRAQTQNVKNVVPLNPTSSTNTATAAAMATLPYQPSSSTHRQPKRVSEKINYALLQGLLRNKKDDDSKEAESQQQHWANHSAGTHLDRSIHPLADDHPSNGGSTAEDRAYEVVED